MLLVGAPASMVLRNGASAGAGLKTSTSNLTKAWFSMRVPVARPDFGFTV